MASCVLSGLNSLAGSVCLLWPGEMEDGDVMGLMKGVAPTTDILLISTQLSKLLEGCGSLLLGPPLTRAERSSPVRVPRGPAGKSRGTRGAGFIYETQTGRRDSLLICI